jgi:hypothetical protein
MEREIAILSLLRSLGGSPFASKPWAQLSDIVLTPPDQPWGVPADSQDSDLAIFDAILDEWHEAQGVGVDDLEAEHRALYEFAASFRETPLNLGRQAVNGTKSELS